MAQHLWQCPSARMVLRSDAARADWLAERTRGVGGSDVPVLLGASPYGSPFEVWLSKVDPSVDDDPTDAMVRGTRLEPVLAQWFSDDTGLQVRRSGLLAHRVHDHRRVNVDRLTSDDGVLEIKTHSGFAGEAAEWDGDGYARRAYVQGQWGIAVTGRQVLWLAALVGVDWHIRGPLPRDEDLISRMEDVVDRFWTDHVLMKEPPPVDFAAVTDAELDARWPAIDPGATTDVTGLDAELLAMQVEQLTDVQADLSVRGSEQRRLENVRDTLRTRLRAAAAGREYLALDGRPVARWATTTKTGQPLAGRIDTKALAADHPDIAAEYTRPAAPRFQLLTED